MPLDSNSDVSDIESATDAEGNQVPVANDGTYSTTINGEAIDSAGVLMTLDTRGKSTLDLALSGTDGAGYILEASEDGETWFGPFESWTGATSIMATYNLGARHVRLRIDTAAADGETASGFMEVS